MRFRCLCWPALPNNPIKRSTTPYNNSLPEAEGQQHPNAITPAFWFGPILTRGPVRMIRVGSTFSCEILYESLQLSIVPTLQLWLTRVLMLPFLDFGAHFIGQTIARFTIRAEIFGLAETVANA